MGNTTLAAAMNTIEDRMNKTNSNKLQIKLEKSIVIMMDRPMTMSHEAFVESFTKATEAYKNHEVANMSALHTAKRGQNIDNIPCTFTVGIR